MPGCHLKRNQQRFFINVAAGFIAALTVVIILFGYPADSSADFKEMTLVPENFCGLNEVGARSQMVPSF
jgi:hypothetical protein